MRFAMPLKEHAEYSIRGGDTIARICIWISFGLGLTILALYVLFFLLLGIGTAILGF